MDKKNFGNLCIAFHLNVPCAYDYVHRVSNRVIEEFLFWRENDLYFCYSQKAVGDSNVAQFEEITKERFEQYLKSYMRMPDCVENGTIDKISGAISNRTVWVKVRFIDLPHPSTYYSEMLKTIADEKLRVEEAEQKSRHAYSTACYNLAKETGFSVGNVFAFKQNTDELSDFYESMNDAKKYVTALHLPQRQRLADLLDSQIRAERRRAGFELGLKFGSADPLHVDFGPLMKLLRAKN